MATPLPAIPASPAVAAATGYGDAPLVAALASSAAHSLSLAPFHFPGHRRGFSAPPALSSLLGLAPFAHDLPELPELDNLFSPQHAILLAQSKAASLFGSLSTFFLINGSTCGIHASIMATCSPGDTLILPRNCHLSAVSAMVFTGALPKFVMPSYDPEWDLAHGIDPQDVERAFVEVEKQGTSKIGAVLITSPTYLGVCSDIKTIAQICHQRKVPLIVDEAHGAHLHFHPELPGTALEQGADIAVQSTHKVLTSLTQSAMLHVQGEFVDTGFLAKCLQTLQSSSPSYLLLASLDAAREQMSSASGLNALDHALKLARHAREALERVSGLKVLSLQTMEDNCRKGAIAMDPLRITVGLCDIGLSGFEADDILRMEHAVVAELPSLRSITFAILTGTTEQDVESLIAAFESISSTRSSSSLQANNFHCNKNSLVTVFNQSESSHENSLPPRDAFFAATQRVDANEACGRPCAELICPYPPGIPILVPGEIISNEAIAYLKAIVKQGGIISGASDSSLETFLICKQQN